MINFSKFFIFFSLCFCPSFAQICFANIDYAWSDSGICRLDGEREVFELFYDEEDDQNYPWAFSCDFCMKCFLNIYVDKYEEFFKELNLKYLPQRECFCRICQDYQSTYTGYIDFLYKGGWPFLKRQIEYTKKYPTYQAYWTETSDKAKNISNIAYDGFYKLFESTSLKKIFESTSLQKKFPLNIWRFKDGNSFLYSTGLANCCFRFSDYYQIIQDIELFSNKHFSKIKSSIISAHAQKILDNLAPLFLEIYNESMNIHPTLEIAQEIEFLQIINLSKRFENLENSIEQNTFDLISDCNFTLFNSIYFKSTDLLPIKNDDYSNLLIANTQFLRGVIYSDSLLYPNAIEAFSYAIQANPLHAESYLERAFAYFELGMFDEAISDFKRMEQISDNTDLNLQSAIYLNPSLSVNKMLDPKKLNKCFLKWNATHTVSHTPNNKDKRINYAQGLCVGLKEGIGCSANEFIPATLNSISGIGKGLWAFVCSPKEVTEEIIYSSYYCFKYVCQQSPLDTMEDVIPELKILRDKWENIDDYQRGKMIGFILGKYGLEVLGPGYTFKTIKKYRELKRANTYLTLYACKQSQSNKALIINEAARTISSREKLAEHYKLIIHKDKQNKHVIGKHNYLAGRSIFEHSDPQGLVNRFAGTGIPLPNRYPGANDYRERINFKEFIGYHVHKETQIKTPTTWGEIRYSKDGTHIVPSFPQN